MTLETFEAAIEAEWDLLIVQGQQVPTQYDNTRLDPKPPVYARLLIRSGESTPEAIGGRYGTHRTVGIAFGRFYLMHGQTAAPLAIAAEMRRLTDVVADGFRGQHIGGGKILSVSAVNTGYINGYHTREARIGYQIDEE